MIAKNNLLSKFDTKTIVMLLVCITLLVYANSFNNSFVWDDYSVIVENDFVQSWKNFYRLFNKSYLIKFSDIDYLGERDRDTGSGEFSYRPVVTLSYFVDFSIWKLNPFGYHLTNIILHTLNTILLFIFIDLIVRNKNIALLTALFFALHPINTEAVNVISFREDLLVFLFFISASMFYIKSRESDREIATYVVSLLMFLLALFSKEVAIIFPVALLCYDYFFKKMPKNIFVHFKKYYLGYVSALLFYFFVRFILISNVDKPIVTYTMKNFYTNIFTMSKVFAKYIQWFLLPVNIHPTLPDDPALISYSLFEPMVLVSILLILSLLVIAIMIRKKIPYVPFAVLWFFITLIPVSNMLFPLTNYIAARYLYLPIVGPCFLIAYFLFLLPNVKIVSISPVILKKVTRDTIIIILVFYSIFTIIRNMSWKNNVIFWSGVVEKYPNNALAHSSLASSFSKSGLLDKAIYEYTIAVSLDPNYAKDYDGLGVCYYKKGMLDEAMVEFKRALTLDPALVSTYTNLGSVFGDKGLYQEAIRCFEKAIQLDTKFLRAYNDLGVTYARMEKYEQAKKIWGEVLQIAPDNKEAQKNLGKLKEIGF